MTRSWWTSFFAAAFTGWVLRRELYYITDGR